MGSFEPSEELKMLLARLTAGQARAVTRIAEEVEVSGRSIDSLLRGPGKICAYSTYYRAHGGWNGNERFQAALQLARREVRSGQLGNVVNEAIEKLKLTTPLAADELRRQIAGDEEAVEALGAVLLNGEAEAVDRVRAALALGQIGTKEATTRLVQALRALSGIKAEAVKVGETLYAGIREVVISALGESAQGSNVQRRLSSMAVLDRASKDTADKGASANEQVIVYVPDNEREGGVSTPAGAADAVPGKPG